MKKYLFLLYSIIFIAFGVQTVSATEMNTGLREPEVIKYPESRMTDDVVDAERIADIEAETTTDTSEWDEYASMYYYNQLSPEYREVWDALDVVCKSYFDKSRSVTEQKGYLESVSLPSGTTKDDLRAFWSIYMCSNPQFYFLKNSYSYSYVDGDATESPISVRLVMYPAFWDGETRAAATAEVKQQLATWQTQIDACPTDAAKLQKIQELICAKVDYNDAAANNQVDEQESFSQSAYSVLCGNLTVCAGYADTFCMLCNASGIDAISVTSSNHQWNKVRVGDSWYNCDATWDDEDTGAAYISTFKYFGRNDVCYDTDNGSNNANNIYAHTEESYWNEYLPLCTLDTSPVSPYTSPGSFPAVNRQVETPEIAFATLGEDTQVTLSCATAGAVLYYTLDGTDPSVAGTRSYKYAGEFLVNPGMQVKAVAVCDSYLDSEIVNKMAPLQRYAISYNLDGGENHPENPGTYTIQDEVVLQSPSKEGYHFEGWYKDLSLTQAVAKIAAGSKGEQVFYAKWIPIKYSIVYDGNGALVGKVDPQENCLYDTEYVLSGNAFTNSGCAFAGWNTKTDGSGISYKAGEIVSNLTKVNGEVITLYAQWKPITYTIVYDGNGADSGEVSAQTDCEYGKNYILNSNNYSKTGYRFAGWNTASDGNGTLYSEEAQVNNLSVTDGEEVRLYVYWEPISYTIVYDGNGNEGGVMTAQSACSYDKTYELKSNEYSRTGYVFAGWNTAADGSGTAYAEGESVSNLTATFGESVTLYARWEPIRYAIVYDGNGSESEKMPLQEGCIYDLSVAIEENLYEKSGYMFGGWNTNADGSGTAYAEGQEVENLTSVEDEEVVLFAQWTPITYRIVYDGNGADSGEMTVQSGCIYDTECALSENVYVKEGFGFAGWNTAADGSGTAYTDKAMVKNLTSVNGATVTLYACWAPANYSIRFDGNNATSGSVSDMTELIRGEEYVLSANAYTRTGYLFSGWNTKADGSGVTYADSAIVCDVNNDGTDEVILYAQWKPVTYTICYNGNGGSGTMSDQSNCRYELTYALLANAYTKTGYTFAGWNTMADGSGIAYAEKENVKNLAKTNGAKIILYAQWRANTYTIRYDGNKATKGSMGEQGMLEYGNKYILLTNKYKRTGYTFTGWNTKANGKGTSYKNKVTVQNLASVNGEVITLYAQWKANKYNVKFHGNGATSGSMKMMKNRTYDKKFKLSANKFKKKGYKFVGWNTKKNGKGKMYKNKAKVKNLASKNGKTVTLYAQWKKL